MAGYSDVYGDSFLADPAAPAVPTGIPVIPPMPAGYVATVDDLNNLAHACTFLLTKPIVRVHDGAGGLAIGTVATNIPFNTKDIDTDNIWSSLNNTRLTINTAGWYKFRYGIVVSGGHTSNTRMKSTTGPNNPSGAGIVSTDQWAGYTVTTGTNVGSANCSGIWPFYLYVGDYLTVGAISDVVGNSTDVSVTPSFFELEYVST